MWVSLSRFTFTRSTPVRMGHAAGREKAVIYVGTETKGRSFGQKESAVFQVCCCHISVVHRKDSREEGLSAVMLEEIERRTEQMLFM